MLAGQRVQLAHADAVLSGARAAAGERVVDEQVGELVVASHLAGVVGVEGDADVEVAVADVADDPAAQPEAIELDPRRRHRGRQLGQRHARVGRAVLETRPEL